MDWLFAACLCTTWSLAVNDLTLLPNGILNYSKSQCETIDASHKGHLLLDDYVTLHEDLTLRDLCLFIQKNESIFSQLFGSTTYEYVYEILNAPNGLCLDEDNKLDYLLISNCVEIKDKNMYVPFILSFSGVTVATDISEEVIWSIALSDIAKYADTQIKCSEFIDFRWIEDKKVLYDLKFKNNGCTLYQIISAVLHEISWYGTPEEKKTLTLSLSEMMHNIETGNDKLDIKNI